MWVDVYNTQNMNLLEKKLTIFHLQNVPIALQYLKTFLWFSNFMRTFVCDHRKVEAKDGLDHRLQLLGDFLSPPLATTHPLVKFNNCKICVNLDLCDRQYWISWLQIPKSFREALFKVKCIGLLAIFLVIWTFGQMYFPDVLGVKYVEALVQQLLRKVKQNRVEGVIWKLADRKQER